MHLFTVQMPTAARAGQANARSQKLHVGGSCGQQGPDPTTAVCSAQQQGTAAEAGQPFCAPGIPARDALVPVDFTAATQAAPSDLSIYY